MASFQEVDVTKENALLRSGASRESLLGKLFMELEKRPKVDLLGAWHIGENKKAMIARKGAGAAFILNPEVVKKSSLKDGYYKAITLSFYDTTGRKQEVKFKDGWAKLMQIALRDIEVMV